MVEGPAGAASGMGGTAPDPYVTGRVADVDWAALLRATDHAETGALGDEFGEQADDVDAHWREG